ncbi:methionine ABC transporter permease [Terrisporobacter vanillatitrophus]
MKSYSLAKLLEIVIIPALWATLRMLFFSGILATVFGFIIGIVLVLTDKDGLHPNIVINKILNIIVNIIRSFPFIILMISIIPLTRFVVGTSIGEKAALVPLTIVATPFIGRIFESSFKEVDSSLIEAAHSFGASTIQIIFGVMLVESIPSIISGLCLSMINLLGATAMAGAIGAGGLGAVALTHGYQNFNKTIMYTIVVILIILVALIQFIGDRLYKKLK